MLNKHDLNTCHFHEGHHQVSLPSCVVSLFPTNAERYWGYKYIYTPHSQFNSHLYFSTQLIIPLGQPVLQRCEMHILPNHIFIYKAGGEIIEPLETNLNLCVHLQIQDMNHIYILSSEKKSPSSKKWKHKEEGCMTGTWIKSHPILHYLNPDLLKSSHDKVEFRGQIQANIVPANVMHPQKIHLKKKNHTFPL